MDRDLRIEIFKRDGFMCVYCGGTEDLCIDHKIPAIFGGKDCLENLVLACKSCNSVKNDKLSIDLQKQVHTLSGIKGGKREAIAGD